MAMHAIYLKKPPLPTESETALVKNYVLLPILLTMLQRDIDTIAQSSLRISLPYVVVMQRIMDTVRGELARVRQGLGRSGIRIYSEEKNLHGVRCKYVIRGYHGTFAMSREDVKAEVSILAGQYMNPKE